MKSQGGEKNIYFLFNLNFADQNGDLADNSVIKILIAFKIF